MNTPLWQQIKGEWKQFTGQIRERWGKLTDDDMAQIEGERDQLIGRIQERYGVVREDAEKQVDEWANSLKERI